MLHWFTRNVADTVTGTHADLSPLALPESPPSALARVEAAIRSLPRWRIETTNPDSLTIHATRRTGIVRFVDDVTVRVESAPGGSVVHARSKSRVGKGDLGQNRRNIKQLFKAIDESTGDRQGRS